jgi:hypothetical protein
MKLWGIAAILLVTISAFADEPVGPIVIALEGMDSLRVTTQDHETKTVHAGDELEYGDTFDTGAGGVRLAFEDGHQVLIAKDSRVTVIQEPSASGDVPGIRIEQGEVRALITKLAQPDPNKPYRFMIHSKAAVMGVRGTDFMVNVNHEGTDVHTVDGLVDMAPDARSLQEGHATPLPALHSLAAQPGRAFAQPQAFNRDQYLASFHQRHPRLAAMHQAALQDERSGRISQRFNTLRSQPRPAAIRRQNRNQQNHPQGSKPGGQSRPAVRGQPHGGGKAHRQPHGSRQPRKAPGQRRAPKAPRSGKKSAPRRKK